MKTLYVIVLALILVCIVSSLVMIQLLPDTVPVHYNAAGYEAYRKFFTEILKDLL